MGSPTPPSGGGWTPPSIEHLQTLLPQYEISRLLGLGGMGAVYEGLQSNLDRKVAIKILPETLSEDLEGLNFTERFKLEAKSMARMNHPGIISVYDFGQTSEGQLYYVMEFIDGMDIHRYLKHHGGKLPAESAIAITAHVLDALGYAHERGIIHRDIKPANIMIKSSGRVKVADFGLVKRLSPSGEGSPDSAAITMSNVAIGTPDFVAPESLETGRIVDHRADLYSVGVMFYQMLTGSVPRGNFKPPSGRVEGLDARLDTIVSRAMESEPDDRYASADEFRAAIDEILSSPVPEEQYTGPINPAEHTSPVTPGGKRLHLTSIQKKTPAPEGSTKPVKGQPALSSDAAAGQPVEDSAKRNPAFLIAAIGLPVIALGIAAFLLMGGGESKKKQKNRPGEKNRPVEIAERGKAGANPAKKPKPSPSGQKAKEKQKSPERPSPKPVKPKVAAATTKQTPPADPKSKPKSAPVPEPEPKLKPKPKPPASKPSNEPEISAAPVDLLAQIDLERDVIEGNWEFDGQLLKRAAGDILPAAIRVATGPFPPEYDVEFQVERLGNEGGGLNLAFVKSGHQGMLVIAGEENEGGWWFEAIDGRGDTDAAEIEAGNPLAIGETHTVRLEVRKERIAAFLNGDEILSWKGESNRLSLFGEWPALMPDSSHLYLGAQSPFAVHKLMLIPRGAGGESMPPVTESPTSVPDPNDPVAAHLAEIDAKYREVFEKPYQTALSTLNTQFAGALKREEQAASQTGDLDLVLAFQNEAKQIGSGVGAGPEDAADAPPKLKELRATWHAKVTELKATRTANQKDADIKRDQALDLLQQELVKAQNIEAAQRVKALRDPSPAMPKEEVSTEEEWISLFDGETLDGWKTSGDEATFAVVGGAIRGRGTRGLLYYEGPEAQSGVFKNFEFRAMAKTENAFNSGIFFHMKISNGEAVGGYEAQIANENRDPKKTGSLWDVSDVSELIVSDGDWFQIGIRVEGKDVTISVNDEIVTRWTEPEDWVPKKTGQVLDEGFFALQSNPVGQEKRGAVWFKDIEVRRLSE